MTSDRPKRNKRKGPQPDENFNVLDYVVPRVAGLIELGQSRERTKGIEFEKIVSETFRLLEFEVEYLGQGTGRNPDVIAKFREDNTAFIIDAKAHKSGYYLGTDDRALYEYANLYCPKLRQEGLKRIAFVIVCNSFKSENHRFVQEITWTTDIRRFIFITSEALLHLLAYKIRHSLSVREIIKFLVSESSIVTIDKVVAKLHHRD
ncbi:MAG: restriction endonuclease FokI C-terminal domain-containing protein [Bacteroidota bacterium]